MTDGETARDAQVAPALGSAPPASVGDDAEPSTRTCPDCVPPLCVQGGAWGWRAHRHALHGEGENPGPHPPPARLRENEGEPWTDAKRAEFHRRNRAARRRERYAAPATPRPPRGTG